MFVSSGDKATPQGCARVLRHSGINLMLACFYLRQRVIVSTWLGALGLGARQLRRRADCKDRAPRVLQGGLTKGPRLKNAPLRGNRPLPSPPGPLSVKYSIPVLGGTAQKALTRFPGRPGSESSCRDRQRELGLRNSRVKSSLKRISGIATYRRWRSSVLLTPGIETART